MALAILAAGPSNLSSFTELEVLFLESLSFLELEWELDLKKIFFIKHWHTNNKIMRPNPGKRRQLNIISLTYPGCMVTVLPPSFSLILGMAG